MSRELKFRVWNGYQFATSTDVYIKSCDGSLWVWDHDAGCLDMDGKLHTAIWKSFDVLMDYVEQQEWLEWYIYDNDCGAAKMKGGFDEVVNPIKNSRDLAKLIVEDEDQDDH
jgi:hypothetical protein